MDKKIEELLEKGKELKTQGSEILKKEKKQSPEPFMPGKTWTITREMSTPVS
ncbi:hypothetical protein LC724_07545 [Blautia sp. RD014234]|nr:hypothetical protein [Blautia parvula]